ncbi:MAG: hypothetical protein ABSD20_09935, partial [Terriglobales bacterium]
MFCGKCGKLIQNDANLCADCRNVVAGATEVNAVPAVRKASRFGEVATMIGIWLAGLTVVDALLISVIAGHRTGESVNAFCELVGQLSAKVAFAGIACTWAFKQIRGRTPSVRAICVIAVIAYSAFGLHITHPRWGRAGTTVPPDSQVTLTLSTFTYWKMAYGDLLGKDKSRIIHDLGQPDDDRTTSDNGTEVETLLYKPQSSTRQLAFAF